MYNTARPSNIGTYKGNARGFRLASLLKLSHTKSHSDKKTTVLRFMVRGLATKQKDAAAAAAAASAAKDATTSSVAVHGAAAIDDGERPPTIKVTSSTENMELHEMPALSPSSDHGVITPRDCAVHAPISPASTTASDSFTIDNRNDDSSSNSGNASGSTTTKLAGATAARSPVDSTAASKAYRSTPWRCGEPPGCIRALSLSPICSRETVDSGAAARTRRGRTASVSTPPKTVRPWGSGRASVGGGSDKRIKVKVLDLEAELGHVRAAAKAPIGEILVDIRQAKRGLKQAADELKAVLAEKEAEVGNRGIVSRSSSINNGAVSACGTGPEAPEENTEQSDTAAVGKAAGVSASARADELGATGEAGDDSEVSAGVRKLEGFVGMAREQLAKMEESADRCVSLCKRLGEFFGEDVKDDGSQSSAHIFQTLVEFLDLLAEAKGAEGLS